MGNRPSSRFAYGVALAHNPNPPEGPLDPESPWELVRTGTATEEGIRILEVGHCNEPTWLVVMEDSVSCSPVWAPKPLPDLLGPDRTWDERIWAYVKRWKLSVAEDYAKAAYIHAPYYG